MAAHGWTPRALRRGWPWREIAPFAAPRRSETEVVSELDDHRVEVRHQHVARLVADQCTGRGLAGLMIQLRAHGPFVASRGLPAVFEPDGECVQVREPRVGARELRQRGAAREAVPIEIRGGLRVVARVGLEVARLTDRKTKTAFERVRVHFP